MTAANWTVLLSKEVDSSVSVVVLEETADGLDSFELTSSRFGPFDTAEDICRWLTRAWSKRVQMPLH